MDLPFQRSGRPLVWGHRGASAAAPENTMAAFALALRMGVDGIELDARLCGSGEVVVFHDPTLERTTGAQGVVAGTPWSVLRGLDAGGGERVPLLADVLAETRCLLNVELKCPGLDDGGLTAAALRAIRDAGAQERVLLSSFNPACLFRARSSGLARAHVFDGRSPWPLRSALVAPLVGAAVLHPAAELATDEAVARWRRRGYLVNCWTVDDPAEARRLAAAGATGIITNAPDVVLAAVGSSSGGR